MELKKDIPSDHASQITIDLPDEWNGVPLTVSINPAEEKTHNISEFLKCLDNIKKEETTFKKIKDPVKWQREQRKSWERFF